MFLEDPSHQSTLGSEELFRHQTTMKVSEYEKCDICFLNVFFMLNMRRDLPCSQQLHYTLVSCVSLTLNTSSLLRGKLISDGWIHQISEPKRLKVKSGWIHPGNVIIHRPDWGTSWTCPGDAQVTPRCHWTVSLCVCRMESRVIKWNNPIRD